MLPEVVNGPTSAQVRNTGPFVDPVTTPVLYTVSPTDTPVPIGYDSTRFHAPNDVEPAPLVPTVAVCATLSRKNFVESKRTSAASVVRQYVAPVEHDVFHARLA